VSPSRSSVGADGVKCSLVNLNNETIVVGRFCAGEFGRTAHGSPVADDHAKVLVDLILLPDEPTIKDN
ncbi:hypothetical protein MKW92_032584, partial [Papaver armeniacum]